MEKFVGYLKLFLFFIRDASVEVCLVSFIILKVFCCEVSGP